MIGSWVGLEWHHLWSLACHALKISISRLLGSLKPFTSDILGILVHTLGRICPMFQVGACLEPTPPVSFELYSKVIPCTKFPSCRLVPRNIVDDRQFCWNDPRLPWWIHVRLYLSHVQELYYIVVWHLYPPTLKRFHEAYVVIKHSKFLVETMKTS